MLHVVSSIASVYFFFANPRFSKLYNNNHALDLRQTQIQNGRWLLRFQIFSVWRERDLTVNSEYM